MRSSWISLASIAMFAYFTIVYPNWNTFRFRMTVEVQTSNGLQVGSSIVEIRGIPSFRPVRPRGHGDFWYPSIRVHGTSPIVDLGRNGWLVVALERPLAVGPRPRKSSTAKRRRKSGSVPWRVLPQRNYGIEFHELSSSLPAKELSWKLLPTLFWLPQSGALSEGTVLGSADDLMGLAGNARLVRITIAPTSDPLVTKKQENVPSWLIRLREKKPVRGVTRGRNEHPFILNITSVERGF